MSARIDLDLDLDLDIDGADRDGALTRRSLLTLIGTAGVAALGLPVAEAATKTTKKKTAPTTTKTVTTAKKAAATSTLAVAASKVCILTPEQEQGPFYVELPKVRANITDGRPGIEMTLRITVVDPATCMPIPNAAVDLWHADAAGGYSTSSGSDAYFLRGVQLTGGNGVAAFTSIFPGWYPRRTNHIHVKVRVGGAVDGATYNGGHTSHTGNIFFDENVAARVAGLEPYRSNSVPRTPLIADFVYQRQNGAQAIATSTATAGGYLTSIVLGVDPKATPGLIGIR